MRSVESRVRETCVTAFIWLMPNEIFSLIKCHSSYCWMAKKVNFAMNLFTFFSIFRSGFVSQKYDTDGDWKEICVKVEKLNIANEEDFWKKLFSGIKSVSHIRFNILRRFLGSSFYICLFNLWGKDIYANKCGNVTLARFLKEKNTSMNR